tara:strand:+ start:420 stop:671 length:252 start_codon:yes stop_codon:yes gene_type:complete
MPHEDDGCNADLIFTYDKEADPKFKRQGKTTISFHYEDELNIAHPYMKIKSKSGTFYISKEILEMATKEGWNFHCEECHEEDK